MDRKNTSVCFSGHRESKLPKNENTRNIMLVKLENSIKTAVNGGYTTFYTGLCNGFDLLAAQLVLDFKHPSVTLVGVVPFRGQELEWSPEEQNAYQTICHECHQLVVLNEAKMRGCYYQRNRYMVEHSSLLICYCSSKQGGTAYTVDYAQKQGIFIQNLYG